MWVRDADTCRTFEAVCGPLIRRSCDRRWLQHADADVSHEVLDLVAAATRGFEYARTRAGSWPG